MSSIFGIQTTRWRDQGLNPINQIHPIHSPPIPRQSQEFQDPKGPTRTACSALPVAGSSLFVGRRGAVTLVCWFKIPGRKKKSNVMTMNFEDALHTPKLTDSSRPFFIHLEVLFYLSGMKIGNHVRIGTLLLCITVLLYFCVYY